MAGEQILIVDDDPAMRRTIARMLGAAEADYGCVEAANVPEARTALDRDRFNLVLCDLTMPGEGGLTLVEEIQARPEETSVLMVTAIDSTQVAHDAAVLGANGYLVKPFKVKELLISVDYALQEGGRRQEHAERERENEVARVKEVRDAMRQLEEGTRASDEQAAALLQPLSEAVGRRDLETGAHIRRIGESSALLAEANGMSSKEVEAIRLAAPMHDIGKVAIPDGILLKPEQLDESERELVKRHAQIGHDILCGSSSPLLDLAATIALTHHERLDGTGYPNGTTGDDIPLVGRIVAIADVYDALTSDRPYRRAMSASQAKEIMLAERGKHFDPDLLDLFLDRLGDVKILAEEFADAAA